MHHGTRVVFVCGSLRAPIGRVLDSRYGQFRRDGTGRSRQLHPPTDMPSCCLPDRCSLTLTAALAVPAAGVVARPLSLAEMARMAAQPGCDDRRYQRMHFRAQSAPVAGGVNGLTSKPPEEVCHCSPKACRHMRWRLPWLNLRTSWKPCRISAKA